jgi:hypothetical protein
MPYCYTSCTSPAYQALAGTSEKRAAAAAGVSRLKLRRTARRRAGKAVRFMGDSFFLLIFSDFIIGE